MTHGERARAFFNEGYNCAQSVFLAFCPETGLEEKEAARLASGLGGGVGRLREVCGAVTGMALAHGELAGYDDPKDAGSKTRVYADVQRLAEAFRQRFGSVVCRDLLPPEEGAPSPVPAERSAAYYGSRPCADCVAFAAAALAEELGLDPCGT